MLKIFSLTLFGHIVYPGLVGVSPLFRDLLYVYLYLVAQNENLWAMNFFLIYFNSKSGQHYIKKKYFFNGQKCPFQPESESQFEFYAVNYNTNNRDLAGQILPWFTRLFNPIIVRFNVMAATDKQVL